MSVTGGERLGQAERSRGAPETDDARLARGLDLVFKLTALILGYELAIWRWANAPAITSAFAVASGLIVGLLALVVSHRDLMEQVPGFGWLVTHHLRGRLLPIVLFLEPAFATSQSLFAGLAMLRSAPNASKPLVAAGVVVLWGLSALLVLVLATAMKAAGYDQPKAFTHTMKDLGWSLLVLPFIVPVRVIQPVDVFIATWSFLWVSRYFDYLTKPQSPKTDVWEQGWQEGYRHAKKVVDLLGTSKVPREWVDPDDGFKTGAWLWGQRTARRGSHASVLSELTDWYWVEPSLRDRITHWGCISSLLAVALIALVFLIVLSVEIAWSNVRWLWTQTGH